MKRFWVGCVVAFLVTAGIAGASAIKSWSSGETLTAADLNANFSHIHNLMVGGHGARLVNADISTSAAIAHSKLATPALIPKAWAVLTAACDGAQALGTDCAIAESEGITTVEATGTAGHYQVNLSYTAADALFVVLVTPITSNDTLCTSHTYGTSEPEFGIKCIDVSGVSNLNTPFSFLVLDAETP